MAISTEIEQQNKYSGGSRYRDRLGDLILEYQIAPKNEVPNLEIPGFNLTSEMERFFSEVERGLKEGLSPKEAVEKPSLEIEANLRTHKVEYGERGLVIPGLVSWDREQKAIVNNYDRIKVKDKVDKGERFGQVWVATDRIDTYFEGENVGKKLAVINSRRGWTGLHTETGEEIEYGDNYLIVFWEDEIGEIKSLTLVTDLSLEQSGDLSLKLGVNEELIRADNERNETAKILGNPALLHENSEIKTVEDLLGLIKKIRGNRDIQIKLTDGTYEYKPFKELEEGVKRRDELLRFSQECEQHIFNLKKFILLCSPFINDLAVKKRVKDEVRRTLLLLTRTTIKEKKQERISSFKGSINFTSNYILEVPIKESPRVDDFREELVHLAKRKGCAGGVRINGTLSGGLIQTEGINSGESLESDQYGSLEFDCPKCKKINRRPYNQLQSKCQHCNGDVGC